MLKAISALLVIDVQKDFCSPDGALYVPEGEEVIDPINTWIDRSALPVIFTRDWHPPKHCSFQENGGDFPRHCVQGTEGAEFCEDLEVQDLPVQHYHTLLKGFEPDKEEFSPMDQKACSLLKEDGFTHLFVAGVATEYCVRATVEDLSLAGFSVSIIADAVRAVDPKKNEETLRAMNLYTNVNVVWTGQIYEEDKSGQN